MKDLPAVEPTAGLNAGVSFFLVLPVSQHDIVPSKANFPGCIDGQNMAVTVNDFCLNKN